MSVGSRLFVRFAIVIMMLNAGSARGDHLDLRLPPLFEKLRATQSPSEASMIEWMIREIWLEVDNPSTQKLLERAMNAMEARDMYLASSQLDQIVNEAPEFAEGWNKRATIHFIAGDFEASMADIQQTLALEPRHFEAMVKLGLICMQLDDPAAALRSFEAALAVHPHRRHLKQGVDRLRKQLAKRRF